MQDSDGRGGGGTAGGHGLRLAADQRLAREYLALGALFVAVGVDMSLLMRAATDLAGEFKGGGSVMILYGYALSSASYRVRIALNLKGLEVATVPVHLRRGEQRQREFLQLNSQGFVPALRLDDGEVLTQSMAIIEYLEETCPQPRLLPAAPAARARVQGAVPTHRLRRAPVE